MHKGESDMHMAKFLLIALNFKSAFKRHRVAKLAIWNNNLFPFVIKKVEFTFSFLRKVFLTYIPLISRGVYCIAYLFNATIS